MLARIGVELTTEFPVYTRKLAVARGEGVWLWGEDGKRYLDMYAGHAVSALGYGHPEILKVLQSAASELFFQSNSVELCSRQKAVEMIGGAVGGGPWSVLLVNSGAEANENALRLAFRSTGRTVAVAVEGAFHGRTAAASAVTWENEKWYGFPSQPFEVRWISPDRLDGVRAAFDDSVAAVIVEPVQGVAGARALSDEFLELVQKSASEAGALTIVDEVQSGSGRTGPFCAFHATPLRPDIVTLGKGIAAGFPSGAVLARQSLADKLRIGDFGTTFGGGPMASALINVVVSLVSTDEHRERVEHVSGRLRSESLGEEVFEVTGKGLLMGLRTHRLAGAVQSDLLAKGVIVGDAKDPHIVRLLPPLTLEQEHLSHFLTVLKEIGN